MQRFVLRRRCSQGGVKVPTGGKGYGLSPRAPSEALVWEGSADPV